MQRYGLNILFRIQPPLYFYTRRRRATLSILSRHVVAGSPFPRPIPPLNHRNYASGGASGSNSAASRKTALNRFGTPLVFVSLLSVFATLLGDELHAKNGLLCMEKTGLEAHEQGLSDDELALEMALIDLRHEPLLAYQLLFLSDSRGSSVDAVRRAFASARFAEEGRSAIKRFLDEVREILERSKDDVARNITADISTACKIICDMLLHRSPRRPARDAEMHVMAALQIFISQSTAITEVYFAAYEAILEKQAQALLLHMKRIALAALAQDLTDHKVVMDNLRELLDLHGDRKLRDKLLALLARSDGTKCTRILAGLFPHLHDIIVTGQSRGHAPFHVLEEIHREYDETWLSVIDALGLPGVVSRRLGGGRSHSSGYEIVG